MATVTVQDGLIHVRLSRLERLLSFYQDLIIPVGAVREVSVVDAPDDAVLGTRRLGTNTSWVKMGIFKTGWTATFVIWKAPQRAISIRTSGAPFDHLIISGENPEELAALIGKQTRDA
jgi:hypothetical protein